MTTEAPEETTFNVTPETTDEEIYEGFWKELVEKNGRLQKPKVKENLSNFARLLISNEAIFTALTGGRLTSPNAHKDDVVNAVAQHISDLLSEEYNKLVLILRNAGMEDAASYVHSFLFPTGEETKVEEPKEEEETVASGNQG